jgi:CheY-like chemotaxis protein
MVAQRYVLVVEDDVDTRQIISDYLRRSHPDVREACDGASALALLEREGPPSVMITDILMPGILGTTVVEYLHLMPVLRDVPIAFVTGSPQLAPQGYKVFAKPAKLTDLSQFVDAHAT